MNQRPTTQGSTIQGATILDADGTRLSRDEKALFREADPFGFILFARNLEDADQIRALCAEMREAVGRDALITIDQEGGRVQRLRPPLARDWLPPLDFAARAGAGAARAMYLRHRLIAAELRALGIDSNCAPLADVAGTQTHPFLHNRCYADTPDQVTALARAGAEGHLDGGVLPVLKHIPGHGSATTDSHFDLPHVPDPLEVLRAREFVPFRALSDLPMAMTAHVVYGAIDDRPATLSPATMQVIRDEIGYDGLIMTDDISMKALSGSPEESAAQSLAAGCDVVLLCNQSLDRRARVAEVSGRMSARAQARADAAMAARHDPAPLDIAAAEAELDALLQGPGDVG